MRQRSRAGGEPAKAQRRKTAVRKSRTARKAVRPRNSSDAGEETKVARLTRELNESLQRQWATALGVDFLPSMRGEKALAAGNNRREH